MERATQERIRLATVHAGRAPWRLWGPYLSERQWGTVREDYSASGAAWDYFPHDHARSRAYRWGEDGLAGISDDKQRLCFALALWNGADPILKERLFGLTNGQGNHGEDVKEYYFYLDNTPTHSYMKVLYKYPQAAFPYSALLDVNRQRKQADPGSSEYELLDTGVFGDSRYFDVLVEYAKRSPTDILIRISITNRGPDQSTLHLLPTLWFRNTWSWGDGPPKPSLRKGASPDPNTAVIDASHPELGDMRLSCDLPEEMLFVENETNARRVFGLRRLPALSQGRHQRPYRRRQHGGGESPADGDQSRGPDSPPFPKDGINDYIISGNTAVVNPQQMGTKAAAHYRLTIGAGHTQVVRLRLAEAATPQTALPADFDATFAERIQEADEFYRQRAPASVSDDQRAIQRQAFAGMLWNKQFFHYAVETWLEGDPASPPPPKERLRGRNWRWAHFYAKDIISMPDKWEYPWFASWDLCFHTVVLALIDPVFAKQQLYLLTREWYMNPEGQVPAYEWAFDDVNPPVLAWAAWRIYETEKTLYGHADKEFLAKMFQHCLLYFTWWVNRKDADENNLFQGGFLGLDNIGAFDRSERSLPDGTRLYQSDGTSWMAMFALDMLRIALELSGDEKFYVDIAAKFFQHFLYIADAMNHISYLSRGEADFWNEEAGLYYSVLRTPHGRFVPMKAHSFVELMVLYPVATVKLSLLELDTHSPFRERLEWFTQQQPQLMAQATARTLGTRSLLLSIVNEARLRRILTRVLDEEEFLGPYGIRSVSKFHARHPFSLTMAGRRYTLDYEPAESTTATFGGNSNWRGPIWFPTNFLLIEALEKFHSHLGDSFTVECPTGSGVQMTLQEVAAEIRRRLISTFERGADGRRPVYGGMEIFQRDPHWRDHILFFEYFHGDNGAGLGASHQTGWTGLVAKLIQQQAEGEQAGRRRDGRATG